MHLRTLDIVTLAGSRILSEDRKLILVQHPQIKALLPLPLEAEEEVAQEQVSLGCKAVLNYSITTLLHVLFERLLHHFHSFFHT